MKNRLAQIRAIMTLFFAWVILNVFRRDLYKKELWLIREKGTEARDNGYHLYKYIRTSHPEINAYYAITKDSADMKKIQQYGNLIILNSFKHYLYYLAAERSINSQPYGAIPMPDYLLYRFRFLCNSNQKVVYLKHGIYKDEISHNLVDYDRTHFDLVCCAANKEKVFIEKTYGYPENHVQLLGLCRFDNLSITSANKNKIILIMPTFRHWLISSGSMIAAEAEKRMFLCSQFYEYYSNLLSNQYLLSQMKSYGYRMVFYPHYAMQPYINCFESFENERIIIADRKHYDVQNLLIESSILITDYSSVFFDFAYMQKPEIFFQFDEEEYRKKHYKEGYFSYRNDGFGPVINKVEDCISEINTLMENEAKMPDEYLKRAKEFFGFSDQKNCERTYQAIIDLGLENG